MRTRDADRPRTTRSRRSTVDPYCVQSTTWTREELLAVRGVAPTTRPTATRRPRRRPTSTSGPKAA